MKKPRGYHQHLEAFQELFENSDYAFIAHFYIGKFDKEHSYLTIGRHQQTKELTYFIDSYNDKYMGIDARCALSFAQLKALTKIDIDTIDVLYEK